MNYNMSIALLNFLQASKECTTSRTVSESLSDCEPLVSSMMLCIFFIIYSFVWSIVSGNWSKVDQIWSITPMVYVWHMYYRSLYEQTQPINVRLIFICFLVTLWGVRLTYNFWKRGGYGNLISHEEDYRWEVVRKCIPTPMHPIFNFAFIALFQNILLWFLSAPSVYVVMRSTAPQHFLNSNDYIIGTVFISSLVMESIADQQHWDFQTFKHCLSVEERAAHPSKDIQDGFFQSGLFRFSRHPNYFAEQMMWFCIFLFGVDFEVPFTLPWTIAGPLLLVMLFQGSIAFGESISSSKYPNYKEYQRTTPQLLPFFPLWLKTDPEASHSSRSIDWRRKRL